MVKSSVDLRHDSLDDVKAMLFAWFPEISDGITFSILRGGYSGTNYLLKQRNDIIGVLKICNGYKVSDTENQAKITSYVREKGFTGACYCFRRQDSESFTAISNDGQPVLLLSYVSGEPVDQVIERGVISKSLILASIGRQLAALHNITIDSSTSLLSYRDGGCCNIWAHISGAVLTTYLNNDDPEIRDHPFVSFYVQRVPSLQCDLKDPELALGVIHGDPFLDNVLVDANTGEFR